MSCQPRAPVTPLAMLLAPCLVATWGCSASAPAPAVARANGASTLAVTRIDTEDAEVRAALQDRAATALPTCDGLATEGPRGHLELSIEVDPAGQTVAGILHTTLGNDELAECAARALTGVTMPARGTSYRVRIRLEGR